MLSFEEFLAEQLKDPEFKKLWDESEEEYQKEKQRIRAEIEQENAPPKLKIALLHSKR